MTSTAKSRDLIAGVHHGRKRCSHFGTKRVTSAAELGIVYRYRCNNDGGCGLRYKSARQELTCPRCRRKAQRIGGAE